MANKGSLIMLTLLVLLTTFSNCLAADKQLKFKLPYLSPLVTPDQCRCEAIVSSSLIADTIQEKGILCEGTIGSFEH